MLPLREPRMNSDPMRTCSKRIAYRAAGTLDCVQPAAAFGNAACCEPTALVMQELAISRVCPVAAGCVTESGSRLHAVQGLRLS